MSAARTLTGKLVAEKSREDEAVEAPVTSPEAIDSGRDEDRLTMPASWLRALHPRRGGAKVAVKRPDASAPEKLAAQLAQRRQLILDSLAKSSDPEIASAGAAYLAGDPTAPPLGAAAVAQVMGASLRWDDRAWLSLLAEAWLAERGLVFTAVAVTELASLDCRVDGDARPVRRLTADQSPAYQFGWELPEHFSRVRAALTAASDAEYAEVVAALAASRAGGPYHRVAASYLAPTETGWVTADCAEACRVSPRLALILVTAVSTTEQAELIESHLRGYFVTQSLALPVTLVDGMGDAAVPVLAGWFAECYDAESRRRLLGVLAELPTDAAMRVLLDRIEDAYTQPALLRAAARFPRRAMRMLATSSGKDVDVLLRAHVLAHADLVAEVVAAVDAAAAERINAIATAATAATAPLEALPEVLVSPPWTRPSTVRKPVVVKDLVCADEPAVVWGPGERDRWRSVQPGHSSWERSRNHGWKDIARHIAGGQGSYYDEIALFISGPDELAGPLIDKWRPADHWGSSKWMPRVVARFELAALPMVLDSARSAPAATAPVLLPFAAPEIAVLMAEWLSRLKSVRAAALSWLARHPEAAARALIPAALGRPGPARRQAEQALAALITGGDRDTVARAAAGYGPAAEAAVADLLAADPLDALPAKMPVLPEWTEVAILTPIHLRGDAGALPAEAVRHVMTMLAISRPGRAVRRSRPGPGGL